MTDIQIAAEPRPARPRSFDPCEGWPEIDARLLNGGPAPAPLLPLDCFGAVGPLLADLAAAKRAPVDYAALCLLTFTAGIVGAARDVRIEPNWVERGILWGALIGGPSASKTPIFTAFKRAAIALERAEAGDMVERRREYEAQRVEAEAIRAKWEASVKQAVEKGSSAPQRPDSADDPEPPAEPRIVVADSTREALASLLVGQPRGLLLAMDELRQFTGNMGRYSGGADEPFYLAAYGGDFSPVDRKKGGTLRADRAYLSVVGGIQPDKWEELLSGRGDDGLVSRFLVVWPDAPKQWLREVPRVDEGRLDSLFARLRSLQMDTDADGKLRPAELTLSDGAADIFYAWCAEQHQKEAGAHGFMAGFLGKSRGMCARVALSLSLIDWAVSGNGSAQGPREVSADAMARACELFANYFEPMARRVYADVSLPRAERDAAAFLKELRLRSARRFNAREAGRTWGVPGLSELAALDAAIGALEECECIRAAERAPGQRGRKAKDYVVNPRLFVEASP